MPLDPSIILQGRLPEIQNPLDVQNKALTMRHLAQQTQMQDQSMADEQAMRQAYAKNMTTGPDGTPTLNRAGFMSDLSPKAPVLAMQEGQKFTAQDAATQKQKLEILEQQRGAIKNLLWQATPENWNQTYQTYQKLGLPGLENLTPQYPGDQVLQGLKAHILSADEQIKQQNADRTYNAQREDAGTRKEANAIARERLSLDKDDKLAKSLDEHLSKGWVGRSGQAGTVQGKINAAEYAEGLIEQGKGQPNGLDSRQIEELAQSTARMLGGTAAASARVEALVPHTAMGRVQTLKEYLSNSPQGADAQAFVDRMAETVKREKIIAETQKRQFQVEGLAAHSSLKKKNPTLYNQILESKGITPDMIDEKGRYKKPAAVGDKPATVIQNGHTYNLNPTTGEYE